MILNNQLCAADYKYFSEFLCRDIAEKMQTDCFYATRKTIEAAIKQWTEENRNNPDVDLDRFLKKTQKTLSNNTNDKENDRKLNEILKEGSRKVMAQKLHDKVLREAAHTQIKASSKGTSTRKAGRAVSKAVSYRNVKSWARMSDTIRGTRFCSVNIYKCVPKRPNFQSLGDRQNKQLINSKQTSNDNFWPILP